MSSPITKVHIYPDYAHGFTFEWEVSSAFTDAGPWTFVVEQGDTQDGPWQALSPPLSGVYRWTQEDKQVLAPKDPVLYFRVSMLVDGTTYHSHTRTPFHDLTREEFLMAQEIMRNELVQAKNMSGVEGAVWMKSIFGPPCTYCLDPVTGDVMDPNCEHCYGTSKMPGYHGPYCAWMEFTADQRDKHMRNSDKTGVKEIYPYQVRMVAAPLLKKDDVLVDRSSNERYYVHQVTHVMELRRVPLIQTVQVREAPVSEVIYELE